MLTNGTLDPLPTYNQCDLQRAPLFPGKSCFPLSVEPARPDCADKLDQLNVIFDVIGACMLGLFACLHKRPCFWLPFIGLACCLTRRSQTHVKVHTYTRAYVTQQILGLTFTHAYMTPHNTK